MATVKVLCLAISSPRSHVNKRHRDAGSLRTCRLSAATTEAILTGRSYLEAVPAQGLTETLTSALVQQHGKPPTPTADQLLATTRKTYSPGSLKVAVVAATPL